MHIELANNNGTKYLRLARCRRGTNAKGKRTILKGEHKGQSLLI